MSITNFFGQQIRLAQSDTGHRAGTDAILLASLVEASEAGLVVDAGAASGAAGLCVARRLSPSHVRLIEIDQSQIALAQKNIAMNGLTDRVETLHGDLLGSYEEREKQGLTKEEADCVITNPPYLDAVAHRASPDQDRSRAHMMPQEGLTLWLKSCAAMLKPKGRLHMIHRADQLSEILSALPKNFGAIRIIPIHPHEDQPATRLLVSATKNSRAPLTLASGFILHEANGQFTKKAKALHEGQCGFNDL
jgi:tRNA1(Val) A37 N6-methylase TrmN6